MHPVDALLHQARQLLGTSAPPTPNPDPSGSNPASQQPTSWTGDASSNATAINATLDGHRNQLNTAHHDATTIIAATNTIGQTARKNLATVETAWQQDKDTFIPTTAQGQAALLQAGRERVTEAAQIVERAATEYQQAAHQLTTTTADLPHTSEHHVQATDYTTAPQSPAKDDPRKYWLGTDDIVRLAPGALGPYGYIELAPKSGVWVPDRAHYPPGANESPCHNPIDLSKVIHLPPGQRGPSNCTELVPGSDTWIPNPESRPEPHTPPAPRSPIDLRKIVQLPVGQLGPWGYTELVPGTWVPEPS